MVQQIKLTFIPLLLYHSSEAFNVSVTLTHGVFNNSYKSDLLFIFSVNPKKNYIFLFLFQITINCNYKI